MFLFRGKWQNRVLYDVSRKNDFKTRFAGSYLGIVWAFVQPVVTILLFWLVFEKAMHAGPQPAANGTTVPYVLWLTAGLVPWFFFQDALNSGTSTFMEYAYLVKKVVFNIGILPVVKVISNLFVHLAFVAFMFVMYLALGQPVTVHAVQILYYSVAMICYVTALVYVTSALCVFSGSVTDNRNLYAGFHVVHADYVEPRQYERIGTGRADPQTQSDVLHCPGLS